MGFTAALLSEVAINLAHEFDDNYDRYRFGEARAAGHPLAWKRLAKDYLRRRGYVHASYYQDVLRGLAGLQHEYSDKLERVFNLLEDEQSKELLIKLIAFRLLGHRKVRLPLNTPEYWDGLKEIERLAQGADFVASGFRHWNLYRMNVRPLGIPLDLYSTPLLVYTQYVLRQYECAAEKSCVQVHPGDIVIDLGGCWGETALLFAVQTGPVGRVYAFEFNQRNLEILRRNLALNPEFSRRIEVVSRAAWEKSNILLSYAENGPGTKVQLGPPLAQTTPVSTLSVDDLVGQQGLTRVDFIKMDIEGAELPALQGSQQTLAAHRPKLAIAVYHSLNDMLDIPQFLDSLGLGYRFALRHFTIHSEETVLFASAGGDA